MSDSRLYRKLFSKHPFEHKLKYISAILETFAIVYSFNPQQCLYTGSKISLRVRYCQTVTQNIMSPLLNY